MTLSTQCSGVWQTTGTCTPTNPCPHDPSCCQIGTGPFDDGEPQASQLTIAPMVTDERTADDFYLLPGYVYHLHTITGTMLTNQTVPLFWKAKVELYQDCNGLPSGSPFATLTKINTVTQLGMYNSSYGPLLVLQFQFDAQDLILPSGTYWLSVIGLGEQDQSETEVWYWASAGNGSIQGRPGQFKSVSDGFPNWTGVDTICCGCRDFSFCVGADPCKILNDNGTYDTTCGMPSLSGFTAAQSVFTADQFVVPPECNVATRQICYISAYVYTNCVTAAVNIYNNNCPGAQGIQPGTLVTTLTPDRITDLGPVKLTSNDPPNLRILQLEFWTMNLSLPTDAMYWISAYGLNSGSLNQVAYFACATDCARTNCPIRFAPARVQSQYVAPTGVVTYPWTNTATLYPPLGHDAAFLIAELPPVTLPPTGVHAACPADFNQDGTVTTQDIFDFLKAWFVGCP